MNYGWVHVEIVVVCSFMTEEYYPDINHATMRQRPLLKMNSRRPYFLFTPVAIVVNLYIDLPEISRFSRLKPIPIIATP